MKILLLNGPNINLLGTREPEIYGAETYDQLVSRLISYAKDNDIILEAKQSNHEGELVSFIQEAKDKYNFIIINPAAYTHTSIAIRDALTAAGLPTIEVHISDIFKRESFRHHSYINDIAEHSIVGKGTDGYMEAINWCKKSSQI